MVCSDDLIFHVPLFFICAGYLYQRLSKVDDVHSCDFVHPGKRVLVCYWLCVSVWDVKRHLSRKKKIVTISAGFIFVGLSVLIYKENMRMN